MSLIASLLAVTAPVMLVALVGYVWAWRRFPFDHAFVTQIVTLVGAPSLVFVTLSKSRFALADLSRMGGASLACLVVFALVATIGLRVAKLPLRIYLPSLIFPNIGNMGLPICLYAFGERGLALAMVYFAVCSTCNFIFGPAIAMGRMTIGGVLRVPFLYAAALAVLCSQLEIAMPQWLINTLTLIGNVTIPLMLMGLGVALANLSAKNKLRQMALALARIGLGLAGGLCVAWLFGLQGAERGVLIIESAMPTALFNYLFARAHGADPDEVAGMVLLSTLVSFATLPALVALAT